LKREKWAPSRFSRLCSAHFITGEHHDYPLHPDYIPSIFVYNRCMDSSQRVLRYRRRLSCRLSRKKTSIEVASVRYISSDKSTIYIRSTTAHNMMKMKWLC
jgi:hypothetical protein